MGCRDMTRILISVLALAALLSTASVTTAQKPTPPGQVQVTFNASTDLVRFGSPLTLSASVKGAGAGLQVKLQRRTAAGAYVDRATATTNDKGDVTFTQTPGVNTTYRAITVEATPRASSDVPIKVAPVVGFAVSDSTPSNGSRVTFRGTVRPQHDGRRVQIQRKQADGTWKILVRPTLRDTGRPYSRYTRRLTIRATGIYRVVLPEHGDHAGGASRERTLTVG